MPMFVLIPADVLQIHWPVTEPQKKGDRIDPSVKETWTAMEKLVDEVSLLVSCDAHFHSLWLLLLSWYSCIASLIGVEAHAHIFICWAVSRGRSVLS